MLTEKDKEWLKKQKWKSKDLEFFEKALRANKVKEPYFIRTTDGFLPLAEVRKFKEEQCLHIY